MGRILVTYASTHGHTAKIGDRIARRLRAAGHSVTVHDDVATTDPSVSGFDVVIVGASIHRGHHQPELVAWAERNGTSLRLHPAAFFSVCLTAAEDSDESRQATRDYLDDYAHAHPIVPGAQGGPEGCRVPDGDRRLRRARGDDVDGATEKRHAGARRQGDGEAGHRSGRAERGETAAQGGDRPVGQDVQPLAGDHRLAAAGRSCMSKLR